MAKYKRIMRSYVTFGPKGGLYFGFDLECGPGHGGGRALSATEKRDFGHNRLTCAQQKATCFECRHLAAVKRREEAPDEIVQAARGKQSITLENFIDYDSK